MSQQPGVLWDLDGVLVDTGNLHYVAWAQILSTANIPFSYEQFINTFGMNNRGLLNTLLGREPTLEEIQRLGVEKEFAFRRLAHGNVSLHAGVENLLKQLAALGIPQAVASSAPQENIDVLVDELEIRGYFDAIVSAYDFPGKPDPAVFLKAAKAIHREPADCVVFEDAVVGIQAARAAGMRCIAISNSHPRSALMLADKVVDTLENLPIRTIFELIALNDQGNSR